jgi:peptidoglycan/xylan/chitin deacetylase (PgdA/CDA1 family)
MANLWGENHPRNFWQCQADFPDEVWNEALVRALPLLGLADPSQDFDSVLGFTLGEGQFGTDRYQLGLTRRLYYLLKPFLPRILTRWMRSAYNSTKEKGSALNWPIEMRFAQFQWEILRQALSMTDRKEIAFKSFWPEGKKYSFVLTHDVETAAGQRLVPVLADLEESLGFRSLFNFVAERYPLDRGLIRDLCQRGFEIGVHGLKHDGKLFNSYQLFKQRAERINEYLEEFQSVGFRSPLTHRNPDWMQMLKIDYDLSFFDTDPYEPMPGGVMSIWPFKIGKFLELPYTLPQDFTLFNIMGETSPRIWFEKVDFLEKYHGMALVIVHPDYSAAGKSYQIFEAFLHGMKAREGCWNALPRDVSTWWKSRCSTGSLHGRKNNSMATASLRNGELVLDVNSPVQFRISMKSAIDLNDVGQLSGKQNGYKD